MGASDSEAREFAAAFRSFLEWVHTGAQERDEVSTQQLTRSLLGVGNDPETLPAGGGLGSLPPLPGRGRMRGRVTTREVR